MDKFNMELKEEARPPKEERKRKTTLCCLKEDALAKCNGGKKWIFLRFVVLFIVSLLILTIVYGLKSNGEDEHGDNLEQFYAVGDPVYVGDLWLFVELASDNRGRRTREGKDAAAHVCSAIKAAQTVGWTPLIVGARSPCCRSSRCRHLHPKDLEKLNYTLSGHYDRKGEIRMALKTAGFLAAIERGAHFIFQANPEVYYRAGVSTKQYQSELERQLRKTTLGISVGMVKSFKEDSHDKFDPYGHFGQLFQNIDLDNNINQYKICEVKPPSFEKFLDTDGNSLDLSAPAFTIPGGRAANFDSRNAAFGKEAFYALFLLPETRFTEKEQYYIRSMFLNAVLKTNSGSAKFSASEVSTVAASDITEKSEVVLRFQEYLRTWECTELTVYSCIKSLGGGLLRSGLLEVDDLHVIDLWVSDLINIGFSDYPVALPGHEPCIGEDALSGVYFHPSVRVNEVKHRSRGGRVLVEEFESQIKKSESFASKMLTRLCPTVDLENALVNYNKFDPHDGILLIVTFYKKDYHNIPLLEIMYRHHFKNILYCGEPDPVVDEYMIHYNGESGTYFSFLPVHHKTSAGYECLLGAIEMGYNVDGFLLVNEDTLVNSWNFNKKSLDPRKIWHGNEHAKNVSTENINAFEKQPQDIMRSMLGILHAFQFLENVLLSDNPAFSDPADLVPPPPPPVSHGHGHSRRRRQSPAATFEDPLAFEEIIDEQVDEDYSMEEMKVMHEDEDTEQLEEHMEHHESSIVDDDSNATNSRQEFHINLFGEIVHDEPDLLTSMPEGDVMHDITSFSEETIDTAIDEASMNKSHEVSELLFHPANFITEDSNGTRVEDGMAEEEHFSEMMFSIQSVYKRIHDQLKLWVRFKKMRLRPSNEGVNEEEMSQMKKQLEHLNCHSAANAEICFLVASYFSVLDANEGDSFRLVYDDLPIYYVPEAFKDRLYLMANLFTKYHVADELAFPLLLRGLDFIENWTELSRHELSTTTNDPVIVNPQDLLSEEFDQKIQTLEQIEAAHYLYPVDVKSVLTNEDLRAVVCRNF